MCYQNCLNIFAGGWWAGRSIPITQWLPHTAARPLASETRCPALKALTIGPRLALKEVWATNNKQLFSCVKWRQCDYSILHHDTTSAADISDPCFNWEPPWWKCDFICANYRLPSLRGGGTGGGGDKLIVSVLPCYSWFLNVILMITF